MDYEERLNLELEQANQLSKNIQALNEQVISMREEHQRRVGKIQLLTELVKTEQEGKEEPPEGD